MYLALRTYAFVLCMCVISFQANTANAILVSLDDPDFGPDSITRDTDTGLEWLDLTHTQSMTVADVAALQGPGQTFEGFSVASTADFLTLVVNGGWTHAYNFNYINDQPKYDLALGLVQMLGVTYSTNEPRDLAYGFVSDTDNDGDHYYDQIFTRNSASSPYTASVAYNSFSSVSASSTRGVWLHRIAAVPEASSALALSLISLGLVSKRRR